MVAAPHLAWVRQSVRRPWFITPVALSYLFIFSLSLESDTLALLMPGSLEEGLRTGRPQFLPQLSGIAELFSRTMTAASLWLHLLSINLFAARHIFLDGCRHGVATQHSLLVCAAAGPLGLAVHVATKAAVLALRRQAQPEPEPAVGVSA
eukprot:CAMPEP_0177603860 /NCGR_PEP_ID=MMETSP0419_2-20121207/15769_1 /TAXON_ID=582737 /ORGANISM="Tetraselmis sp., Strain GSL018" /LENGTH=149 /DNA_ID=CAMNT_0019097723 /DNA_START=325 /DNA_END=774 /DNA_ORIENTATION=-